MDFFSAPKVIACGNARFQIDNAQIRSYVIPRQQGVTPDVCRIDWLQYPAIRRFGKLDVPSGILYIRLVQKWITWTVQYLVDTSSSHDIAAQ
jgi:hypothetical protein